MKGAQRPADAGLEDGKQRVAVRIAGRQGGEVVIERRGQAGGQGSDGEVERRVGVQPGGDSVEQDVEAVHG
jgi:hypothetical protein